MLNQKGVEEKRKRKERKNEEKEHKARENELLNMVIIQSVKYDMNDIRMQSKQKNRFFQPIFFFVCSPSVPVPFLENKKKRKEKKRKVKKIPDKINPGLLALFPFQS